MMHAVQPLTTIYHKQSYHFIGYLTRAETQEKIYLYVNREEKLRGLFVDRDGKYTKIKASQIAGLTGKPVDIEKVKHRTLKAYYDPRAEKKSFRSYLLLLIAQR